MKKPTALLVFVGILLLAALACGPLSGLSGIQATVQSAQSEIEVASTELAAQLTQNAPQIEAALTEAAATLEASAGQLQPTLDAAMAGVEATATAMAQGQAQTDGNLLRQWAAAASATSQYGDDSWSARQATGIPDTYPECGDIPTAWATLNGQSSGDSITLTYNTPVVPTRIEIYETNSPGAIVRVEVANAAGERFIVYEAAPTDLPTCPNILGIDVAGVSSRMNQVIIYLDQSNRQTAWNEIDAVELIGIP